MPAWPLLASMWDLSSPIYTVRGPGDTHPVPETLRAQARGCLALPGSSFPYAIPSDCWTTRTVRTRGGRLPRAPRPLHLHGAVAGTSWCCPSLPFAPSCPVPSRPLPSPGRLFKMHIRAVCHPPPEIRRWLPTALRVKSQVLARAHTPVLGAHLPSHLSPPRSFTPWAWLP